MNFYLKTQYAQGTHRSLSLHKYCHSELISISLNEINTGKDYRAISSDFNPFITDTKTWENIIKPISQERIDYPLGPKAWDNQYKKTNFQIAKDILNFIYGFAFTEEPPGLEQHEIKERISHRLPINIYCNPETAAWDWTVFCQLYGPTPDHLPPFFPHHCLIR